MNVLHAVRTTTNGKKLARQHAHALINSERIEKVFLRGHVWLLNFLLELEFEGELGARAKCIGERQPKGARQEQGMWCLLKRLSKARAEGNLH